MQHRPFSTLSKKQREETPLAFAQYLVRLTGATAVLWVRRDTVYRRLGLDIWDKPRDAHNYDSDAGPIICHPPCGPWGKLSHKSTEEKRHGIKAMELVHRYGGVVEQPAGSQLFKEYGRPGALILWVNQSDYGHLSMKPTDLYLWGRFCSFRTCRFCGRHRGQLHSGLCNWTDINNPFPEVLYGSDDDWDNTSTYTDPDRV